MTKDQLASAFPDAFEYLFNQSDKYGLFEECMETFYHFTKNKRNMTSEEVWQEVNDALWEWDI